MVILLGPRVVDVVSTLLEQEAKKRARMPAGLEAGEGSRGRPSKGASGSTENRRERKAGARHEVRAIHVDTNIFLHVLRGIGLLEPHRASRVFTCESYGAVHVGHSFPTNSRMLVTSHEL